MPRSIAIQIFVWIFIGLLNMTGVFVRGQTPGPNAVALINGQTMLDCNTSDLANSNWRLTPDGNSNYLTIATGCNVTGNNAAYYRTEIQGSNICRLIIANVTMQQAGVYICYNGGATFIQSLVTVIDSVAGVVVYNRSEVVVGDQLNISCSVNYNGPTSPAPLLHPLPFWTTAPEQIFTNATHNLSANVAIVIATVTVQKYTVPVFHCKTVFEITGSNSFYNSTAPADSFVVGSTTEIVVQYPVEPISISSTVPSEDKCVSKPENLTCTAIANPPAQYVWTDLKTNITTIGANKSISSGGEYQCIASNSIRNQTYNATKNVAETSCHPPFNLTINGTSCANNVCTCNGNASSSEEISITCMAFGNPRPSVKWQKADGSEFSGSDLLVTHNGNYTCIASNNYGGKYYIEKLIIVVEGCQNDSPSLLWLLFLIPVGLGLIFGGLFPIPYDKSGKKGIYNKQFPFLKTMLPCMNTSVKATTFELCGWIFWIILYILMVTIVGVLVIPFMFIKVQFCSSVGINKVELSGAVHSENAEPSKETIVDEKTNEETVTKNAKKKKKKKVTV